MATVKQVLDVRSALPASSGGAQHAVFNGTNFPVASLKFDASVQEAVFFQSKAVNYGSGNLQLRIDWYADTASSGDVIWGGQIAAITPDADSQDVETKAFAAATTVTDSHLGTVGQRLHTCLLVLSNLDSIAADDAFWLKLYRDAAAGGDTMTGDAQIVSLQLEYSDT